MHYRDWLDRVYLELKLLDEPNVLLGGDEHYTAVEAWQDDESPKDFARSLMFWRSAQLDNLLGES